MASIKILSYWLFPIVYLWGMHKNEFFLITKKGLKTKDVLIIYNVTRNSYCTRKLGLGTIMKSKRYWNEAITIFTNHQFIFHLCHNNIPTSTHPSEGAVHDLQHSCTAFRDNKGVFVLYKIHQFISKSHLGFQTHSTKHSFKRVIWRNRNFALERQNIQKGAEKTPRVRVDFEVISLSCFCLLYYLVNEMSMKG